MGKKKKFTCDMYNKKVKSDEKAICYKTFVN